MTTASEKLEVSKPRTLQSLLEDSIPRFRDLLPEGMKPEKIVRTTLLAVAANEKLRRCSPLSVLAAVMECARLGLEPGGILGHAYLVPYEDKKAGIVNCQLVLGYRGMLELALRSDHVDTVEARPVYAGDDFDYRYGLEPRLHHVPAPRDRGKVVASYAIAVLGAAKVFWVVEREDIDLARSKSRQQGIWNESEGAMAAKTAIRRLFKFLPTSVEVQEAIARDVQAEYDMPELEAPEEGSRLKALLHARKESPDAEADQAPDDQAEVRG